MWSYEFGNKKSLGKCLIKEIRWSWRPSRNDFNKKELPISAIEKVSEKFERSTKLQLGIAADLSLALGHDLDENPGLTKAVEQALQRCYLTRRRNPHGPSLLVN